MKKILLVIMAAVAMSCTKRIIVQCECRCQGNQSIIPGDIWHFPNDNMLLPGFDSLIKKKPGLYFRPEDNLMLKGL